MNFIRKHKKASIITLIILIIILLFGSTFARYIYNLINNYILETKEFYFNSNILAANGKEYRINNWDGVNDYVLTIDVNSRKSSLAATPSDIKYDIEVSCPSSVECSLNKQEGIIYQATQTDTYQITIHPTEEFYEGDEIEVETTATSSFPYVKSLSATYHIGIETSDFTYDIEDAVGDKFFTLNLTNTVSYYQVERAFGSYQKGDRITIDEYRNLTDAEKENCFSAKVTLNFTPRDIFLDMTNTNYLHRIPNSEKTEVINNFNYVNEFSFKMDASSSAKVMFYKDDPSQDYTYPIINDTSIINVTVETAE